jgi:hypothetical protein
MSGMSHTPIAVATLAPVFAALGLGAGVLTTIAGQGGGLLLLLACSALIGPRAALAVTAPALLLGNLHRAALLRAHIDRTIALRLVVGAVPGALAGGLLVGVLPASCLQVILVGMTVLALAKALGFLRFQVPPSALTPAGVAIGAMTGTAGGAGVLFAPVLLSTGLTGRAFVATSSVIALSTHLGRLLGYAGLGLLSRDLLLPTVLVAAAIFGGNALGDRLRTFLTRRRGLAASDRLTVLTTALEYGTLVVCVVLSVAGLG